MAGHRRTRRAGTASKRSSTNERATAHTRARAAASTDPLHQVAVAYSALRSAYAKSSRRGRTAATPAVGQQLQQAAAALNSAAEQIIDAQKDPTSGR